MVISLIGMSGSGKTYWSKRLAQKGFVRFCCDDLIEEKLAVELRRYGYSGLADMSKWMGQPFDTRYAHTSARYLELEKEVMLHIFAQVLQDRDRDIVIDTTGSVIYTGSEILEQLCELSKVIYIDTPLSVQREMYEQYLKDPKPVIWGDAYAQRFDESPDEALGRNYPSLLVFRTGLYKHYAHVTVNYSLLRGRSASVEDFLRHSFLPLQNE